MTRAFLLGAVGVVLVQLLPQSSDDTRFNVYYLVALAALVVFLSGMAFAAHGCRVARWGEALAAVGGVALAVFATPRAFLPPAAELMVFLLGGLSFGTAAVLLAHQHWSDSRLAAILAIAGGGLGALELLRAGFVRYAQYFQTRSIGISGIIAWTVELAVLFGLAGLLAFAGGAVARAAAGRSSGRGAGRPTISSRGLGRV